LARSPDASGLPEIERRAGQKFPMANDIADHEPRSIETFFAYTNAGRCLVACDNTDRPIGFLLIDEIDGNAHIEQVSVEPEHQGMGVGRSLIDYARAWAKNNHRPGMTLTTFVDIHGPMYTHLGFSVMQNHEIGPELRALRREEAARGYDQLMPRVCMMLRL
jgi:GNAT superfamily N-acetyltransferase